MKGKVIKKIFSVLGDIIMYLFLAICIFAVFVTIVSKKDSDGTATIFGYQVRFVQSPSMEKCDLTDVSQFEIKDIRVMSAVFIETVPDNDAKAEEWYSSLKVGDVITFKYVYTRQETITHRIVAIEEKENGGYFVTLEGDNKNSSTGVLSQTIDTSDTDSPNYIIGKVTAVSYPVGILIYSLKQPMGLILIVILPCLIIIVLEIMKIVSAVSEDKKNKITDEKEQQQREIDELKRQLSDLQAKAYANGAANETQAYDAQRDNGGSDSDETQV